MYYRYMDDTFIVFDNERECDLFLEQLNSLHPSLQFTFEKECNQSLPFLDVMVKKKIRHFCLQKTHFHRPILYICWNSFSPRPSPTELCLFVRRKNYKMN